MDAVLLVSFGGPESMDEVMPFLRKVTAGRDVPDERLQSVAEHYFSRGGVSPINAQTAALQQALQAVLDGDGLRVFWGNRNSQPWLADAYAEMAGASVDRAIAVFTSAYSSYSGCRQYRENLAEAQVPGIETVKIPAYYNNPGFVKANLENLLTALVGADPSSRVIFTTHSIPVAMASASGPQLNGYVAQHRALAGYLMRQVELRTGRNHRWDLVYQSRSGPPRVPWLEPDINDHLRDLAETGTSSVVVAPIGFVSDHMEVVQDLDTEAAATAAGLGLGLGRVPTVGVQPAFVEGLAAWIRAVRAGEPLETVFDDPLPSPCVHACCPNPRQARPALCEQPT